MTRISFSLNKAIFVFFTVYASYLGVFKNDEVVRKFVLVPLSLSAFLWMGFSLNSLVLK